MMMTHGRNSRRFSVRYLVLLLVALLAVILPAQEALVVAAAEETTRSDNKSSNNKDSKDSSYNPISLQDSVKKSLHQDAQAARERYWKKTLEEIRSIGSSSSSNNKQDDSANHINTTATAATITTTSNITRTSAISSVPNNINDRWKRFSSGEWKEKDRPERYNGVMSWERLLQEWSEDIQEYLDKIEASNSKGQGYPMSTFGRLKEQEDENETGEASAVEESIDAASTLADVVSAKVEVVPSTTSTSNTKGSSSSSKNGKKVPRPVPAPRKEGEAVLAHTDISDKSKRIWIVTTASLPWMTGTAVNPLLRAAYMSLGRKEAGGSVTLMLPWLERKEDQDAVYGQGETFDTPEHQEDHIRGWLKNSANMKDASEQLNIRWYTAWQNKVENSLYSMGDIVANISEDDVDIIVLEEPEHMNWYRAPGESWTKKFKHVVGIVHTNYFVYAQDQPGALVRAPAMKLLCTWMCRSHCHRLIKLSGTLPRYAPEKELIENVHGVRGAFLDAGEELRQKLLSPAAKSDPIFSPTAEPAVYFIGKMLWSKGIGSLMELLKYAEETANIKLHVDMYGGGPDQEAAEAKAKKMNVDMSFLGPIDHPELALTHKVFINPSTSEVLCTTVAEALAMGKFVVLPSHPSNDFFAQFPNCLPYASKEEFVGNLYYALTHSPEPLSEEYSYALSWKAATERFEAAGCIPVEEAEQYKKWVESGDAGIDITLPPLIENEKGRKLVASTLEKSRANFRKFRETLSQDVGTAKVLPKTLRDRLAKELDKRLDLDIDELLKSPKLELKLSPAELDKQCIELYEYICKGPSGDVLRVIGGGQEVAMQHRYMKRQAMKQLEAGRALNISTPFFVDHNSTVAMEGTASQRVRWTMRRNLPTNGTIPYHYRLPQKQTEGTGTTDYTQQKATTRKEENNMQMSLMQPRQKHGYAQSSFLGSSSWSGLAVPTPSRLIANAKMISSRRSAKGLSLLI